MTELRIHYWPDTPHLRELKFFVNEKLELSVFCDANSLTIMKNTIGNAINQIAITNRGKHD
jgi:hypothetical protein